MSEPQERLGIPFDDGDELPPALAIAVENVQTRTATPTMVANVTAHLLRQKTIRQKQTPEQRLQERRFAKKQPMPAVIVAGSMLILVFLFIGAPRKTSLTVKEPASSKTRGQAVLIYSPVTRLSLLPVVFQCITDDLDQAGERLEKASESLKLAAIRRQIQETLEEYHQWRN